MHISSQEVLGSALCNISLDIYLCLFILDDNIASDDKCWSLDHNNKLELDNIELYCTNILFDISDQLRQYSKVQPTKTPWWIHTQCIKNGLSMREKNII